MLARGSCERDSIPYVALHAGIVDDLVNVVGCYTRLRRCSRNVQNLTRQPAHLAHAILLLLGENSNLVPVHKDLLRARDAVFRVVRELDALLHFTLRRERVYGSQSAGVGERGEWVEVPGRWIRFRNYFGREDIGKNTVLRLVLFLVLGLGLCQSLAAGQKRTARSYPIALEAVLRAEVALLAHLLAVRTLQRARIVSAVCAAALARGVGGHVCVGFNEAKIWYVRSVYYGRDSKAKGDI